MNHELHNKVQGTHQKLSIDGRQSALFQLELEKKNREMGIDQLKEMETPAPLSPVRATLGLGGSASGQSHVKKASHFKPSR